MAEIPKAWGVSGNAFGDPVGAFAGGAFGPYTDPAFANAKAEPVAARQIMVVAGAAGNISVSRQYLIVKQKLSNSGLRRVRGHEIIKGDRVGARSADPQNTEENRDMDSVFFRYISCIAHVFTLAFAVWVATPVFSADLEEARDLMEAGEFVEARAMFEVLARSGNADAEELIGVMYALGLGVERDDERAFEWYLRASLKGHPGAQSGLGWYYEVGRGIPEPDLVRAYLWYALSAIGGDVDAPDSLEELTPRMTAEERARAEVLIDDYRPWMYPFR